MREVKFEPIRNHKFLATSTAFLKILNPSPSSGKFKNKLNINLINYCKLDGFLFFENKG